MIFFLSDFGTTDAYVGVVEAVMASIAPGERVVHLTHGVPPQDIRNASCQLWQVAPHLPDGSVVLVVVDPGVGSARRAIVVEGARLRYVAPDNGVLEAGLSLDPPRRVFSLDEPAYRRVDVSPTFHGRDVFGPAAAHLARGVSPDAFGRAIDPGTLTRLGVLPHEGDDGEIWTFDHFGNAITTLKARATPPTSMAVGGRGLPFASHYAAVAVGEPLGLVGSSGLLEVAVRDGSAREALGLEVGDTVTRA